VPNLYPTEEVTVTPETSETSASQVKFGRSWRFDFDTGDFVLNPIGKVATANELDAYIEWCQKALLTPRYWYPIYSRNYGSEFKDLIGRGLTSEAIESEIKRMVTETLMVDPRTAAVDNFSFTWESDTVSFICEVTMARGETAEISSKVVIG
jgi:phage baseplate assembly protein W